METPTDTNQLLSKTALWTASVRARETRREDRVLTDPWAAALAGEEGAAWLAERSEVSTLPIVLRTRYFDDFLQRISIEEGIRQVVLMAAGLDTRAFRLHWLEGTRLFELDQADLLQYKEQVLQSFDARPTCERCIIQADLTVPWENALIASGFEPQETSCWLLEGFLFYLPTEAILQLIDVVTALAAQGSWIGFDVMNSTVFTSPLTKQWVEMQALSGAPWIGSMDDPEGFLTSRGWSAKLTQAGQLDANHGRWTLPVFPTKMPDMPHNWFVTAKKE